ncbi:MAG TPA: cupredoxin domain-containing protein [Alphaproteobacteria bacterium]|jgi:plastocyanin
MTARLFAFALSLCVAAGLFAAAARAEDPAFTIEIKDHKFRPAELAVPAGKKVKLVVENLDSAPEEFESHALRVEKVIPGGREGVVFIGPLQPGRYDFVGEFHEKTARRDRREIDRRRPRPPHAGGGGSFRLRLTHRERKSRAKPAHYVNATPNELLTPRF